MWKQQPKNMKKRLNVKLFVKKEIKQYIKTLLCSNTYKF